MLSSSCEVVPYSDHLAAQHAHKDRYGKPYTTALHVGESLLLPRKEGTGSHGHGYMFNIRVPPKPEQIVPIMQWKKCLDAGQSGQFQMMTGGGKTYAAISAAQHVGRRFLYVVNKADQLIQFIDEVHKFTDVPPEHIGEIRGPKLEIRPITVATVQTLAKSKIHEGILAGFGFAVFDEIDVVNAEYFSKTLYKTPAKYRWGMSATPKRKDGRDLIARRHLGPVRVVSTLSQERPFIIQVDIPGTFSWSLNFKNAPKGMTPPRVISRFSKKLAACNERNQRLADIVAGAYNKGRCVILMADTVAHLKTIEAMLLIRRVNPEHLGLYIGGMKAAEREAVIERARVFLATYKMASRATNIPKLDTLVLGTPKSDVIQIVGRIRRPDENKQRPVVVDIVDPYEIAQVMFNTRRKWYTLSGFEISNRSTKHGHAS